MISASTNVRVAPTGRKVLSRPLVGSGSVKVLDSDVVSCRGIQIWFQRRKGRCRHGCVIRNWTIVHFFDKTKEIWSRWGSRRSGMIYSRVYQKGVLGNDGSGPDIR